MPDTLGPGRFLGSPRVALRAAGLYVEESVYAGGATLPAHAHAKAHLCFVLRGRYREHIDGAWVERSGSDLVFYPAGVTHAEDHRAPGRHLLIELSPDDPALPERVVAARSPRAAGIARRIRAEALAADPFAPQVVDELARELAADVWRETPDRAPAAPWLDRVLDRLHDESAMAALNLEDLGHEAGVHPVHLARAFRARTGLPVGEYRRRLALERACRLLESTDRPLAEVALEAGFCDQSHLTRVLRRYLGTTPARLRRER